MVTLACGMVVYILNPLIPDSPEFSGKTKFLAVLIRLNKLS